jgi:hypothetical protein
VSNEQRQLRDALEELASNGSERPSYQTYEEERTWVEAHRDEFLDQWVALDGGRLISHGSDAKGLRPSPRARNHCSLPRSSLGEARSLHRGLAVTHHLTFDSVYDYGTEAIILICKELFPEQKYVLPMSAEEKRAAFPVRLIDVPERLQPIS